MPNGKPGDHPWTDIVIHGKDVYSQKASSLVREIARLADDKTSRHLSGVLVTEYNEFQNPDVTKLERYLTALRDELAAEAKARGFEQDDS